MMGDEDTRAKNKEGGEEQTKRKAPLKVIIVVAGLMLVEAVAVVGLVMLTSGGPQQASADELEGQQLADEERLVEIELINDTFQNRNSGQSWMWQTELYLQVRNKNKAHVEKTLEERKAEIAEGVRLIISKAQDRHLKEPGNETIRRQLTAYINDVFGTDAAGDPRVERLIIAKFDGFPAE